MLIIKRSKNNIEFSCKNGIIDEVSGLCTNMLFSISHLIVTVVKCRQYPWKSKDVHRFTHTEGVTGSLEVHSRHVMSIVVPQSLNKETREVRRSIESRIGAERGRGRSMKKKKKARVIIRYRSDSPRSSLHSFLLPPPSCSSLPVRPFPSNALYRSRSHSTSFVASFPVMRYIPSKSRASFRGY